MARSRRTEEERAVGTWAEHRNVEQYDHSWMDVVEDYYISHPDQFSASKIRDIKSQGDRKADPERIEHMVKHIKNAIGRDLVKEIGKSHREEIREAKSSVPPSAAMVVVSRNRKRYVVYRDVYSGRFISGITPVEKTEVKKSDVENTEGKEA